MPVRAAVRHLDSALAAGALLLAAGPASADVCLLMDLGTAEAFAGRVEAAGTVLYGDWFAPIPVEALDIVADGNLFAVWLNGTIELDAAYTYVPGDDGTYVNAGLPLGCEGADVTAIVPGRPFAPDEGAAPILIAPETPRLIGIVETPMLFDAYLAMAELERPVTLRDRPTTSAPVAAEIGSLEAIEMLDIDYDRIGAAAYGEEHGWYRVRRGDTLLWLPPEAAGPLHGYPDVLVESLSYLAGGWDGRLYATPRPDAARQRLDAAWRAMMGGDIVVDVRGTWNLDGAPWILVDLLWPAPCEAEEPKVIATGWVPAHAASGAPAAWFYARGC